MSLWRPPRRPLRRCRSGRCSRLGRLRGRRKPPPRGRHDPVVSRSGGLGDRHRPGDVDDGIDKADRQLLLLRAPDAEGLDDHWRTAHAEPAAGIARDGIVRKKANSASERTVQSFVRLPASYRAITPHPRGPTRPVYAVTPPISQRGGSCRRCVDTVRPEELPELGGPAPGGIDREGGRQPDALGAACRNTGESPGCSPSRRLSRSTRSSERA
jgi:hypothetical protein